MVRKLIRCTAIVIAVLLFTLTGCAQHNVHVQKAGGFAIYLTEQSVETSRLLQMDIESIPLEDMPVITIDDIISYEKATHTIELIPAAYDRLMQMGVPVNGRSFVVCLDGKPVYAGAFWVMWSSLSFDGVVILLPALMDSTTVRIELGYPGPGFFRGKDPRNNKKIFRSLEQAGKLK
jgi:hypothetical protein